MASGRPAPVTLNERPTLPVIRPSDETARLSVLVYGKPGVGKTVFCGTAEDDDRTAPVLFCDVEGGRLSISHRGASGKLDVYPVLDFAADMNRLVAFFQGPTGVRTDTGYKTLVLDSLSEAAVRAMDSTIAESTGRHPIPGVPEYSDWNAWTNRMRALIMFLRDLPLHLVVTCLEEDADGAIQPAFPGKKLGPQLPAFFNTVGRLYVAPTPSPDGRGVTYERRLTLSSDVRVTAKDRSDELGQLPREMVDPTVTKLLNRMAEGRTLAAASLTQKGKK